MDYDKIIMIIYFNTYKDTYDFEEIKEYLGFSFDQLDDFINELIVEKLLEYDEDYILKVSNKAIELLETLNLRNILFEDLLLDYSEKMLSDIRSEIKLNINDVYIPENFDKKFKGYSSKSFPRSRE
ncbi:hypothetical protein [Desnuesiella massiliensis]|uniref:hypothetical protein n=1 Tax=Desnuesiella massiliensis TaxID=1650662 RepID=UPI0006E44682|nr:hypothetical protein [Desnuesiella massiliensis]